MSTTPPMTRMERFRAAVAGHDVDRVPCTFWVHYMTENLGGTEHALRHARWVRDCDWDICKIVNDYHYPFPPGLETLRTAADMLKFKPASLDEPSFVEELKAVRILRAEFGPDMPLVLTTFDPLRQVVRRAGLSTLPLILEHPREATAMLGAIGDTMCRYMAAVQEAGADGIFFATNSGLRPPAHFSLDDKDFATFMRPYELQMLEAMQGMVRVLHVHGDGVDFSRIADYPCEVINVADRLPGNPTLAELRRLTDKCLMGGIDQSCIRDLTPDELGAQIRDAVSQAGRRKFILAPGCTIPPWTPWHLLVRARQESRLL